MIKKAFIHRQNAITAEDVDLDLGEVAQAYPLIPSGEYDVVFVKAHKMSIKKSQRLITYWQILHPDHLGKTLIMGFPYPKKGRKKWGALSKMAECYRIAAGRDPDRFDTGRLSTAVFKGKVFLAKVVTVTRSLNQYQRQENSHYSVIERLIAQKTD